MRAAEAKEREEDCSLNGNTLLFSSFYLMTFCLEEKSQNLVAIDSADQCRRNEIHMGGGLPIVFFLIHYNVIKETYFSLTIIWGAPAPQPPRFRRACRQNLPPGKEDTSPLKK